MIGFATKPQGSDPPPRHGMAKICPTRADFRSRRTVAPPRTGDPHRDRKRLVDDGEAGRARSSELLADHGLANIDFAQALSRVRRADLQGVPGYRV